LTPKGRIDSEIGAEGHCIYLREKNLDQPVLLAEATSILLSKALPYLTRTDGSEKNASESLGAEAWDTTRRLWGALKPRIENNPHAVEATWELAENPEDPDFLRTFKHQVRKILEADPQLASELAALMAGLHASNLHYEAVLSGSGAIAQGSGAVATGQGGVVVGRDVHGDVLLVGHEASYERVVASTNFVLEQLEMSYRQAREQADRWSKASLGAAIVGLLLVAATVVILLTGNTTTGVITAISSLVPTAVSGLFFAQVKSANTRVDLILEGLARAREIHSAVEVADTVTTRRERDKLIALIVRKALRIESV
jgi:hypothetical protein